MPGVSPGSCRWRVSRCFHPSVLGLRWSATAVPIVRLYGADSRLSRDSRETSGRAAPMTDNVNKPPSLEVLPDNIPQELRGCDQWVVWRYEYHPEKSKAKPWTKPPCQLSRAYASSTNPATWTSFETVLGAYRQDNGFDGVGYAPTEEDGITFVDLDNCRNPKTGEIAPWALEIIKKLNSYTEISPSGTGLRIIARAALPPGGRKKGDVEMYDEGHYLTLTGHHIAGTPTTIESRQAEIEALHGEVFGKPEATSTRPTPAAVDMDDMGVINKAKGAKHGDAFSNLWVGDWDAYPSHSEADLTLVNHLVFWAGSDCDRVDRLFRQSGLFRNKWDKRHFSDGRTYGQATIELAVSTARNFYSNGVQPAGSASRDEVLAVVQRWLWFEDVLALDVILAVCISNWMAGDPVWLFVIAPPGGTKTELLRSLQGFRIVSTSTLTPQTLISGLNPYFPVRITMGCGK